MPDIDWDRVRDCLLAHALRQRQVTGELRRRLIRAFLDQNVRVAFPPHVVASGSTTDAD